MKRVTNRQFMLMIQRRGETFLFYYTDRTRKQTGRLLGDFASRPELSFDWSDAARSMMEIERMRTSTGPKMGLPAKENS